MDFSYYINKQIKLHPSTCAQDILKQAYQSIFGVEHLIANAKEAEKLFFNEYSQTFPKEGALFERISKNYIRVNIASWKQKGLQGKALFYLFLLSAQFKKTDNNDLFISTLENIADNIKSGNIKFCLEKWEDYVSFYLKRGISAIHHSDYYRINERPSYRVVNASLIPIINLLIRCNNQKSIIAIDGRCSSGKTTLATYLAMAIDAQVIHMDDFFLPFNMRTSQRESEIGGNIHYERFRKEVISKLCSNRPFIYQIYNCSKETYSNSNIYDPNKTIIIEGSYSSHPKFAKYYDYLIFTSISKKEQLSRIINRNGIEMLQIFKKEWIPKEEAYFKNEKIKEKADYLINNN